MSSKRQGLAHATAFPPALVPGFSLYERDVNGALGLLWRLSRTLRLGQSEAAGAKRRSGGSQSVSETVQLLVGHAMGLQHEMHFSQALVSASAAGVPNPGVPGNVFDVVVQKQRAVQCCAGRA